jgi:hypothetical protein
VNAVAPEEFLIGLLGNLLLALNVVEKDLFKNKIIVDNPFLMN